MRPAFFANKIIHWYEENRRELPWRETSDPYKIWLSEIILQQTRVAQGLPYYEKFVKSFPTVFDLAEAPLQKVLRIWQGLGYYSRARNLHTCAKVVVKEYEGGFPDTYKELIKLKGIGPYTAAAVASIAFKEPVAVVDGNVFRVLSRIFGIEIDITTQEGKIFFLDKANALIPPDQPHLFNQAMMEFGALHCLPQNPKCDSCIFSSSCLANRHDWQKLLPVKSKKLKVRTRYFYYFVIRHQNKVLMKKRENKDIWQGLYDYYLIETKRSQKSETLVKADLFLKESSLIVESKIYTHILSHQKLKVRFFEMEWPSKKRSLAPNLKWFSKRQVEALPKPILIVNYLSSKTKELP
jgi:A/G-specific adenine glycosylase